MQRLPDDVLLEVMQYLDVPDLLACRLVCKRLTELALHPDVWRHQSICHHKTRCYACAVLSLAPCLRSLHFSFQPSMHVKDCQRLFATTTCAVKAVSVNMVYGQKFFSRKLGRVLGDPSAADASLVIRNQERLGRMRSLNVTLDKDMNLCDASVVIRTVATTSGLERLQVSYFPSTPPSLTGLQRSLPRSSLKYFSCELSPLSEAFCNLVLTTHAATLEEVDLGRGATLSASTGSLLGRLPNLRTLTVSTLRGLEAAAGCASLTDVTLDVTPGHQFESRCRSAAEFLRRATQLRTLHLDYYLDDHDDSEDSDDGAETADDGDADLVLALGASGCSRLERLEILNDPDDFPQMGSLLRALPGLPALQYLDVWGRVPNQFLLGITPATAPALRTLEVRSSSVCAHHFLHRSAVQKVLSLNPSLKLLVYRPRYCRKSDSCDYCARGCHQEELWDEDIDDDMSDEDWNGTADSVVIPR